MQNWKTTVAGVLTIIVTIATAGLSYLKGQPINATVIIAGVTTGAGLIAAKDGSNHSTIQEVEAATKAETKAEAAKAN